MSDEMLVPTDIYLSFFMFTTNLKPHDSEYTKVVIQHIKKLKELGYTGFEFPIAPGKPEDYLQEIENYTNLRCAMDNEGWSDVPIATNVGTTQRFDPSSDSPEVRQEALEYLKARVDITAALRGEIMMGPLIVPYGYSNSTTSLWSDALQDELAVRYTNAQPILQKLGEYAELKKVKVAIEPITHWETPGPNKLSQLIEFLKKVDSKQVGVVIDSAHEILDGDGPEIFEEQVKWLAGEGRLHYVQVSPPDRGAVHTSWIPWESLFKPILQVYKGPMAIEIFNAIPDFHESLRLTRRKFWIPGEDPGNQYPSAYDIARDAIEITRDKLNQITSTQ
ncbi:MULTISPECIES: sugar phosphate isomerase/epimerase family protein [unclassified Microcoleus]|uniref:sugar phosphate isomerase/epimerase family protein n=1 Tax=unclassified Microcoleus TaxID=2642155 RepID=UPI0025E0BD9E|nr:MULTISPECIES: sugar phosphate isomerase/epimerase family protein [unclassified Microcoleus]